jgi:Ca2+-binding EF-hand superfamily protein
MASRGNGVDGGGDHDTHFNNKTRAHRLFAMFDKNKNGKISIGEFKGVLDKFSIGFTVDEVGDIVRELDEDGNIMIGVEEFEKLLEKYTPEELQD